MLKIEQSFSIEVFCFPKRYLTMSGDFFDNCYYRVRDKLGIPLTSSDRGQECC